MINVPQLRRRVKDLHNIGPALNAYRLRAESLESRHMLAAELTFADPVLFDVDINPEHVLVADSTATAMPIW